MSCIRQSGHFQRLSRVANSLVDERHCLFAGVVIVKMALENQVFKRHRQWRSARSEANI
jgi:hypothetical protein